MLFYKYPLSLIKSVFVSRYKRFFVDVITQELKNNNSSDVLTVHCANSGSMKSCLLEGATAYISDSQNFSRKLRYSFELIELEDGLACLNTMRANQFVEQLLSNILSKHIQTSQFIQQSNTFQLWDKLTREVVFSEGTRFDFCLTSSQKENKCWIEVKSVSLKLNENTWAFPDAVTERGQKHLKKLMCAKENGDDAWLFFVMMRGSCVHPELLRNGFRIAYEIDPTYAKYFAEAVRCGVRIALIIPDISVEGFGLREFYFL